MAEDSIKSVRRVFEIFELFDRERRPVTAKEVSDELGYPLTSAHALLKSMHKLGYTDFDPPNWTYTPSRKFTLLAAWFSDFIDRETQLLECMEAINQETKETVNLSRLERHEVKIIHGLECVYPVGVSVKVGTLMHATQSLTGLTALASLGTDEFEQFVLRLENMGDGLANALDRDRVARIRQELEERGTVSRTDMYVEGIGAVALPIQTSISKETMVIGVVGPSERISRFEAEYRRTLKRTSQKFGVRCRFKLKNPRN